MTEAEWLACTDPTPMLEFLRGKTSNRKLHLFAVACCRRIWNIIGHEDSRRAVEVMERYVDGLASQEEVTDARQIASEAERDEFGSSAAGFAAASATCLVTGTAHFSARKCAGMSARAYGILSVGDIEEMVTHRDKAIAADELEFAHQAEQASLLREIQGNPFQSLEIDSAWLRWCDGVIPKLAQAAYEERQLPCGQLEAFPLATLADALEEAGCANEQILGHLREPGLHVRGCWVVDLLLGKE